MGALDLVGTWPGDRPAAAVIGTGGTLATTGPDDEKRPWASVTKLLTALAVLCEVESGTIDLDEPAGPPGATVRHLLAHTSGLPFDRPTPIAQPGRRRIYSNAGFEVLGELVGTRAGTSFAAYLDAAVLTPLGMSGTTLDGSPAAGAHGPLRDLAALGRELLAPTLLVAETLDHAVSLAFPGLNGVLPGFGRHDPNDWGLGFELRDTKAPHWTSPANSPGTFGHFGRSGSFLWVDPEARLACCALSGTPFDDWCKTAWPEFSSAVLDEFAGR